MSPELIYEQCISWELRRPNKEKPNWFRGAHLARQILDHSDPGYRYWKPRNVQCSKVRAANANWAALACILAQPVTPLGIEGNDRNFNWLLQGTEREVRTIHGGTGLSPKLLHIYAQITHLCAGMIKVSKIRFIYISTMSIITSQDTHYNKQSPDSIVVPIGALKIEEILNDFRQRSELSDGYANTEALFESCVLNDNGKVDTATKVTELTGEAWVWSAKIYLHCRFFR